MTDPPGPENLSRDYAVAPLELFFDLVFVFSLLQLSHHLLEHLSWRGAAETAVMLLAVFSVWYYTSWEATMLRAERSRTAGVVVAVMVLSLFMNASVSQAFSASGWAFVVPFLLIQLGRTSWSRFNAPDALWRRHDSHTLIWMAASSPLWIVGAAVGPDPRLLWWSFAAAVDLTGTVLAHPVPGRRLRLGYDGGPEGSHMLERCRLFLLIALGETVISTGGAIAAAPMEPMTVITGTVALASAVALWALAFGGLGHMIRRHVEKEALDPIRAAARAGNALLVMVAGLIAIAVANQSVIAHPYEHTSVPVVLLLFAGPLLFLLAPAWYLWAVLGAPPPRRVLIGAALLLPAGATALAAPAYLALILAMVVLAAVAVLGGYALPRHRLGKDRPSRAR